MKILQKTTLTAFAALAFASTAQANVILMYDSLLATSGGSATALSRIDGQTDTDFVTSSQQFNTFGSKAIMAAIAPNAQTNVQGAFGNQNDLMFRFGSDGTTPGGGILSGPLSAVHAASGPRIDFSYTAAQAQNLTEFSFHLFNNSNNATSYGARDVGLFVSVGEGDYLQFGDLFNSATGNGNQGTVVFSDSFAVATGQLVDFRLAFTDRTRTSNDLQAATRIGDVQISAVVPEPGTYALIGGLLALTWVALRRRVK
ncbi:MAG: PEP-CTERM sorting domain-containing protein [Opitutales bacterium]|nr:PEP-CTERM sorting domain-containing protein [Opitutales bacterium]MDP4644316.1 PEP-CTERM sorting domain-containing protein [Opitutales bacterium]